MPPRQFKNPHETDHPLSVRGSSSLVGCRVAEKTESKSWWQSKIIWVNAITAATATLTVLSGQQIVSDHPAIAAGLVAAIGALNVALRIITVLPIGGE